MEEAPETRPQKSYWSKPNNWIRLATLIAVLIYTGFQVWQTILIRTNNVVSQRAFVSVGDIGVFPNGKDAKSGQQVFSVAIPFINSGNTPTEGLSFHVKCGRSPDDLKEPWALLYQEEMKRIPQIIAAHAIIRTRCDFINDDLVGMSNGTLYGYVMGEIFYKDRLDESEIHRTQFEYAAHDVRYISPGQIVVTLDNVGLHNCADQDCPVQ